MTEDEATHLEGMDCGNRQCDPQSNMKLTYEDLLEALYNLNRADLRRLAWEALLISDGPDQISDDSEPNVVVSRTNGVTMHYDVSGKLVKETRYEFQITAKDQ